MQTGQIIALEITGNSNNPISNQTANSMLQLDMEDDIGPATLAQYQTMAANPKVVPYTFAENIGVISAF